MHQHFAACSEAFGRASQQRGLIERHYLIAARRVQLRFAGETLDAFFSPALAHLETSPSTETCLTVDIWDTDSTGVELPEAGWISSSLVGPSGESNDPSHRYLHRSGDFKACMQPRDRLYTAFDANRGRGFVWVASAATLAPWDIAKPLRPILQWWGSLHGLQFVHAGAVGNSGGGVLLAGRSGSGKTTTALACLQSGLGYAGDDYLLLEPGFPPTAHSLYSSAVLYERDFEHFPFLRSAAREVNGPGEKVPVLLFDKCRDLIVPALPIRALVLPHVANGRESRIEPISRAAGLTGLAPSTIFQMRGTNGMELLNMAKVIETIPCYRLALGTDLDDVVKAIRDLMTLLEMPA